MSADGSEAQVLGGGWSDQGFRAQVGGAKASTLTGLGRGGSRQGLPHPLVTTGRARALWLGTQHCKHFWYFGRASPSLS